VSNFQGTGPEDTAYLDSTTREGSHVYIRESAVVEVQQLIRRSFWILQSLDQELTLCIEACEYVWVDVCWQMIYCFLSLGFGND
jgi:hypothetical protein